jgi:hypothetical protein
MYQTNHWTKEKKGYLGYFVKFNAYPLIQHFLLNSFEWVVKNIQPQYLQGRDQSQQLWHRDSWIYSKFLMVFINLLYLVILTLRINLIYSIVEIIIVSAGIPFINIKISFA